MDISQNEKTASGFCKRLKFCLESSLKQESSFIKQILPDSVLFQYMVSYKLSPKSYIAKDSLPSLERQL